MEIPVVRKVLDVNDTMAQENRDYFTQQGVYVFNLMSSPGSGKTTLLTKVLQKLAPEIKAAVIVGDVCTTNDADRLSVTGAPVVQITTDDFGGDCHLAAHVIRSAAKELDLTDIDLLIVENIGNLVCPAEFEIGEDSRGVVLSITEGEDKPLKYPLMFRVCNVAILNKMDLVPYLEVDADLAVKNMLTVHPEMPVFKTSATKDTGLDAFVDWLKGEVNKKFGK
ncbi:Hydrogenase nickel incorporation protein HypB [Desulfatibacillum aliphaticivorans]|uniref:Hydrogenase nickel incorporation protein HypB n=1 Tax=Desulfatibacillum aliphaticivorans TaxID=218208 RepID=B8FH07_DESAL|nr:hydrogenase nickel incorporation protein HypB [Desulfatibacillum aliphaticivorans]ACL02095.1 Hydrogenase nickel incorporation protein HypB [Desulfatibacillum aliphaticivorans]